MAYKRRNREFEERIARLVREKNYQPPVTYRLTDMFPNLFPFLLVIVPAIAAFIAGWLARGAF